MHHVYSDNLLNHNQFGLTPKKSTTGAAMTVKEFVEERLRQGLITVLVSLGVNRTFNAAWWTRVLRTLKYFNCRGILYYLTKSYFGQRTAVMSTNSVQVEKVVSKGCPQVSYLDQVS
jgi:hypothetical protein